MTAPRTDGILTNVQPANVSCQATQQRLREGGSMDAINMLGRFGVQHCQSLLDVGLIARLAERIEPHYRAQAARPEPPPGNVVALPGGGRYIKSASSFSLDAVVDKPMINELIAALAAALNLASKVCYDLDQAWVRRQYPTQAQPPGHRPHQWHQDGALGFDFCSANQHKRAHGLLPMVTCWFPLTACGQNAPGLEFLDQALEGVVSVAQLEDRVLRARFPTEQFIRPHLHAGDVLLFGSGILHRTLLTPAMHLSRTSIELRFFAQDIRPPQLATDRFLPLEP